jgi:epoxyqueuosine reductase QueG
LNSPERSHSPSLSSLVDDALAEAGVSIRGFVPFRALREALDGLPEHVRAKYGTDGALGAAVVALPYGEGPSQAPEWARAWLSEKPSPLAKIARFARANWYAELVQRLKKAAVLARGRIEKDGLGAEMAFCRPGAWPCLANSGLPEKRLALAAGLGSLGRHGLVMVSGSGPACVLGVLLLPFEAGQGEKGRQPSSVARGSDCGSCRACLDACPTGALSEAGFERLRCIQHWSTVPGALPSAIEAAWGDRLYGCEACLEACPRYRPDTEASTELGLLGPGLPLSWLLEAQDAEIKGRLRGSALGMRWMSIDAFRRNARLALRGYERRRFDEEA